MKRERIFYCDDEGEFYLVKETDKTIKINWIAKYNCDREKTPLDFNVRWRELKVGKELNRRHCLREFEDDYILIYPDQAGIPFALDLATQEHIQKEIENCNHWGVSSKYYQELSKII